MIPLINHDSQWGRSEVVIIYPDMVNMFWSFLIDPHIPAKPFNETWNRDKTVNGQPSSSIDINWSPSSLVKRWTLLYSQATRPSKYLQKR